MKTSKSIVILTGAGISAESGIHTFRDSDGLWENHRVEDVASPEGFARDPELIQRFYNQRRRQVLSPDIQPNLGHLALAKLEQEYPGNVLVITQNIDNLHERAGSKNLIHMHGEILKMRCNYSQKVFDVNEDIQTTDICSCCQKAGNLRPHIVWFGEMPLKMEEISEALRHCDLFLSIGTSGNVYPAAGFVQEANWSGAHSVELNLEPSSIQSQFAETYYGKATALLPNYVNKILSDI